LSTHARRRALLVNGAIVLAVAYSVIHVVASGIIQPLRTPAVGQIVEELQPLYRLFTTGAATVDHPRQYGPVFLMLFHPAYRMLLARPELLAWYAYALDVIAIAIAVMATLRAIRTWAAWSGITLPRYTTVAVLMLWANFSPLYGVLAVKNVELWELALIAVAGAAVLEERRWLAGSAIAAAALIKMLPLVFFPYLLLRDRRTFAYALVAFAAIIVIAQVLYGYPMGFGYVPMIVKAALGGEDYGNGGMTWHENVSLRGLAFKAFGFLEKPGHSSTYQLGYWVVVPAALKPFAKATALVTEAVAVVWLLARFVKQRSMPVVPRWYWEWALVAIMMMVLAPQISQDYMVLTLGAFSCVLVACMVRRDKWLWIQFAVAVLLVGNIVPRAVFGRLMLVDRAMRLNEYGHLTLAEGFQYFGFPLLGLLVLLLAWRRVADAQSGG
jgi:hypothetical protein